MVPPAVEHDVFVSHAHKDGERVRPLVEALRREGLRVWFDEHAIHPHDGITRAVREGIERSKVLLAYYSRTYPTRRACQWELTAAFVAAQRLGEDPSRRVLVVNPERTMHGGPHAAHVQPVQLRDALFGLPPETVDADGWSTEAVRVAQIASSHSQPLGSPAPAPPRQLGRRLVGAAGFVGRLDDLWQIHSALSESDAVQITAASAGDVAQLAGMGGIGKSLLAEEYALRFGAAYPGGVFWLDAGGAAELSGEPAALGGRRAQPDPREQGLVQADERSAALAGQLAVIATDLGLAHEDRTIAELRAEIAGAIVDAGPSLWVVDDLPTGLDEAAVRAWIAPHPNARTLITTRSRNYAAGTCVELGGLPSDDGYELLTARRSPGDDAESAAARGIVADLGGHPLALSVAGHALHAEAGLRSFADYRAALADLTEDELALAAELAPQLPNGHEPSIAATLLRSVAQLGTPGRELLQLMSMMAPLPFAKATLAAMFAATDEAGDADARRKAVRAVEEASALSLVESVDGERGTFSVHALVARTMRYHSARTPRMEELQLRAPDGLVAGMHGFVAAPEGPDAFLSDDAEWNDLIAHARALASFELRNLQSPFSRSLMMLLYLVGSYDVRLSKYRSAIASWTIARELFQVVEDTEHPLAVEVNDSLADAYVALEDLPRARALAQEAVDVLRRTRGPNATETLAAEQRLAQAHEEPQRTRLLSELAARRRALFGEHDPDTLVARGDEAALQITRDPAAAAAALEQLVATWEQLELGDDLRAVRARHNLGVALTQLGEHGRARELLEHVLATRRERLREGDEDTVSTMYSLAALIADTDPHAAAELLDQVVAVRTRIFGQKHSKTQNAVRLLAALRDGTAGAPTGVQTTGRNDPCPCGSGRKYKRCHGA